MCCACGGGSTDGNDGGQDDGGQDDGGDSGTCVDTDNGAKDNVNTGCADGYNEYYDENIDTIPLHFCGDFDDDDFIASELCCVCGGGSTS